jgi:hypothetical protein
MARSQSPSRTIDLGGVQVQVATRTAHFAHDTDLRDGDLIEITAGELVGSVWRIVESDAADQQTARRVPVIATERPRSGDHARPRHDHPWRPRCDARWRLGQVQD